MSPSYDTLVILGPTASGKTRLAARLAHRLAGEVISADSRQVYRELTIGSGKDWDEYRVDGDAIPVHLLDTAGLDDEYNVFRYQRDCWAAWAAVRSRERLPVIAGGTGLYLEAVLDGYVLTEAPPDPVRRAELDGLDNGALGDLLASLRPAQHNTTDLGDRARLIRAIEVAEAEGSGAVERGPDLRPLILGTQWPREALRARIRRRLVERLDNGLIEEVQGLLDSGVAPERLYLLGLEYRYVTSYIEGAIRSRNDLVQKLAAAIGQFAKRQETWFRRMEKRGTVIHWVEEADFDKALGMVEAAQ